MPDPSRTMHGADSAAAPIAPRATSAEQSPEERRDAARRAAAPRALGATDALLILMAAIWGINYTVVKFAAHAIGPLAFTEIRVVVAAVTLLVAATIARNAWPDRRTALSLLGIGVLGNGVYQLCFVMGVSRTRVADAALIVAAAPAIIALIESIRGVERHARAAFAGIALCMIGVAIVSVGGTRAAPTQGSAFGVVLMLVAVVIWSVYTIAMRAFTLRVDPIQLNALTMSGGAIPLLLLSPFLLHSTTPASVTPGVAAAILYSSVISMGFAYMLWYRGLRVLGATRTAVYGNLQPVVAILVGWIALSEAPTLPQLVGAATIISGILLTRVR